VFVRAGGDEGLPKQHDENNTRVQSPEGKAYAPAPAAQRSNLFQNALSFNTAFLPAVENGWRQARAYRRPLNHLLSAATLCPLCPQGQVNSLSRICSCHQ